MKIYLCWLIQKNINSKCLMGAFEKKEKADKWLGEKTTLHATKEIQEVSVIMEGGKNG